MPMKRSVRLLSWLFPTVTGCCWAVFLNACDTERPAEPRLSVIQVEPPDGIFVVSGGDGDGSSSAPLGSVQAALDAAVQDSDQDTIYVAVGLYHESLVITSPVVIFGGRNPDSAWQPSGHGATAIMGGPIDGQAVAVYVSGVSDTVELHDLDIYAADAVDSGASSIGLVCSNVTLLRLSHCHVRGYNGATGRGGVSGETGTDGAVIASPVFKGGSGGQGGALRPDPGQPGFPGYCADGSATGGQGGSAPPVDAMGRDGYPGAEGTPGDEGPGGMAFPQLMLRGGSVMIAARDGGTGVVGEAGCGGGGGAGSATWYVITHTNGTEYTYGCHGGAGGNGGGPGSGGTGGFAGGASIAILASESVIVMSDNRLYTSTGGDGGTGGLGGQGGAGAPGAQGEQYSIGFGGPGGDGGDGGNGGRGGHGGGGAGGSSIGVVAFESTVSGIDSGMVNLGLPGLGGESAGASGEHGLRLIYLDITE
jgi:hypothetical protein